MSLIQLLTAVLLAAAGAIFVVFRGYNLAKDINQCLTEILYNTKRTREMETNRGRFEFDPYHAWGMRYSDLTKMTIAALPTLEQDVTVVVKAGYDVHAVWDEWTDEQRALATLHARAANSESEDPGPTPTFLEPYIREDGVF